MKKETIVRLHKLESNFFSLMNRVDGQEQDIFFLKSNINNQMIEKEIHVSSEPGFHQTQHKREKRQIMYPPPQCHKGPCAFDLSTRDNINSTRNKTSTERLVKKPASCEDLKSIGHFLSGFYLIEANQQANLSLTKKILTVFCDFSLKKLQSSTNQKGKWNKGVDKYTLIKISIFFFKLELLKE